MHRGSLTDVLSRFVGAARQYAPSAVVRLTGDCPLADWAVINSVIDAFLSADVDYASNISPPTFPDGLDVEVIRYQALLDADAEAELPNEREHVTPFIRNRSKRFASTNVRSPVDLSSLRWTVDEPADFEFVKSIYEALYPSKKAFDSADILSLLKARPELRGVSEHIVKNAAPEMRGAHQD